MKVGEVGFMGHKPLQAAAIATLEAIGESDAPVLFMLVDDSTPTVYAATSIGVLRLTRTEGGRGFVLHSELVAWDEARGAGLAFAGFLGKDFEPSVTFTMINPDIHETATSHDASARQALLDFAMVCVRERKRTGGG